MDYLDFLGACFRGGCSGCSDNLLLRQSPPLHRTRPRLYEPPRHPERLSTSSCRTNAVIANRVIHDYAAVTDDVMWKIVINDLPKLKSEVDAFMAED